VRDSDLKRELDVGHVHRCAFDQSPQRCTHLNRRKDYEFSLAPLCAISGHRVATMCAARLATPRCCALAKQATECVCTILRAEEPPKIEFPEGASSVTENEVKSRAYAMPLTNPAFPPGPYRFANREFFVVTYRTDADALRAVVPEPLQVTEPIVKYEFIRMPDSTGFGDYTESGQVIPGVVPGREGRLRTRDVPRR